MNIELALRLANLLREFDAELLYTTDDDGIHIRIAGEGDIVFWTAEDLEKAAV